MGDDMDEAYASLNRDMWWTLRSKTAVATHVKVRSSGQGNGLDGYRKIAQWCIRMSGSTIHQLRIDVMKPQHAAS